MTELSPLLQDQPANTPLSESTLISLHIPQTQRVLPGSHIKARGLGVGGLASGGGDFPGEALSFDI